MSNIALVSSLQNFLNQRGAEVEKLTAANMVALMIDWFRLISIKEQLGDVATDAMLFRYGGWSEGCATGFNFGLLRRVTLRDPEKTQWQSGITLMFEPSRYAGISPFQTESIDWQSLEAFVNAIESSAGYRAAEAITPMAVMIDAQGLR